MEASAISLESSKKLISCNVYTLKVPNFFTLPGYQHGGFDMNSPSFEFEDATWCFRCHSKESEGVINSFSFNIRRLKTEYSRHNLFYKVSLFQVNNLKCDGSKCDLIIVDKTDSNQEPLHSFKNNCTYHDGYGPLTIIVHLFPLKTVEVDAKQTSSKKGSLPKRATEMEDGKISLESTNKTVSSDFYSLKFPLGNQKHCNLKFKLDNAMCCFIFSADDRRRFFTVRRKKLNDEKSFQNIFMKCISTDGNDTIIGNHFKVFKKEDIRYDYLGSFSTFGSFCTLHVYLLKEEVLDIDADPAPIMKTRASVPSISTNESNSAIKTSPLNSTTSVSVPPISTKESNSAITTFELSSDTSDSVLLSRDLKKLFLNGVDCDLTLKVTGEEFKVHRLILRARSQVFEAMLSHDMIEQNKGIIDIPDIDAQAMEVLLVFIYSGEVDSLNESNVLGVYYAADKYNMAFLKDECSELMKKSLSPSIICDAIQLALNHGDTDLLECCKEYFVNHVSDILPTVEWMSFMKSNPIAANELFIKATKKWDCPKS